MFLGRFCHTSGVTHPPPFCFLNELLYIPSGIAPISLEKISGNLKESKQFSSNPGILGELQQDRGRKSEEFYDRSERNLL